MGVVGFPAFGPGGRVVATDRPRAMAHERDHTLHVPRELELSGDGRGVNLPPIGERVFPAVAVRADDDDLIGGGAVGGVIGGGHGVGDHGAGSGGCPMIAKHNEEQDQERRADTQTREMDALPTSFGNDLLLLNGRDNCQGKGRGRRRHDCVIDAIFREGTTDRRKTLFKRRGHASSLDSTFRTKDVNRQLTHQR